MRILGIPCISEGTGTLMIASNRALEVKYSCSQMYCYAGKKESFKEDFEATEGLRGTLRREAGETTSLGLKTKLGLRPNSRDMAGLIYK